MESSQDPKEDRSPASIVAFGLIIGSSIGAVLLSITGNAIWLAILPGLGLVVGAALEANRAYSRARS